MDKELLENRKNMIYEFMCSDLYVPMKLKEMAILMDVPRDERGDLEQVLSELLNEGKIELSRRGKYSRAESRLLCGTFAGNVRGFGFVSVEGEEQRNSERSTDTHQREQSRNEELDQLKRKVERYYGLETGKVEIRFEGE